MNRFFASLLVIGLIFFQAHMLVPHHHHQSGFGHSAHDHHEGQPASSESDRHAVQADDSHHQIGEHQDTFDVLLRTPGTQPVAGFWILPSPPSIDFARTGERLTEQIEATGQPLGTGPPGSREPARAPPVLRYA